MTALLSKTFLVWFTLAREIQLESYGPRYASVGVHVLQVCIYITIWYATTLTTKLTYLMTAYYTSSDGFTAYDESFFKTKLASYTTHCRLFQLIIYAFIKMTIRGTTLLLYEFGAKQPKKNKNQG